LDVLQTNRNILDLYETGEVLGFEIERDETRLLLLATIGANDEARRRLEEYRAHWPKTGAADRASKFLKDFGAANS
jgi:transposase